MYLTTIAKTFSAAHFLREYEGRCENLHGHNWRVEVTVRCEELDRAGMGLDFRVIKEKTAAAVRAGIKRVVLPARNQKDLEDVSEDVRSKLEFIWASEVGDVLKAALEEAKATLGA